MAQQRTALISVANKDGIVDFAQGLVQLGFNIVASKGSAEIINKAGVPAKDVAEFVGGGPILGHRVVTLSREVSSGLLSTLSEEDIAEMEKLSLRRIDLVCCDMYALKKAIDDPAATFKSVIDKTDVGGPTMLHSGAKGERIVICDPADRVRVLNWLREGMPDKDAVTQGLMAKAEFTVSRYIFDSARYHGKGSYEAFFGELVQKLRYGENPYQTNAFVYEDPNAKGNPFAPSRFKLVGGKGPSYINMTDIDRLLKTAVRIAAGLERNEGKVLPMALAVKHGNACGVGVAETGIEALKKCVLSDPTSLSGGCVVLTYEVDGECAEFLRTGGSDGKRVLDTVIAPKFTEDAIQQLSRKNEKCRMFENPALGNLGVKDISTALRLRQIEGGFLTQDPNVFVFTLPDEWKTSLSKRQQRDMVIAWGIGTTQNSNTIVLVYDGYLVGRGVAQPSRVFACKVALLHARENGHDDVIALAMAYSDSFFPFDDGPKVLAEAGVKVVFATSGSVKDAEVLESCKRLGIQLLQLPDTEARGFDGH